MYVILPSILRLVGRTALGLIMIKLFSVKQKQKEAAESANGRAPVKKQSPGELRVQKGAQSFFVKCFQAVDLSSMNLKT